MINNQLDVERYRLQLARQGRVQVPRFLQEPSAERLRQCLLQEVPFATAERGLADVPPRERTGDEGRERLEAAYGRAAEGFHFIYDRYLMVEALREGRDADLVLRAVLEFLNSEPFLQFARYFSGDRQINAVGAQATRYLPGQFLRLHDDHHADEGRRYAYVINLSKDWQADWGGLLHFTGPEGQVLDSFVPRWNSLSLFKVPANHFVGLVAPWAREPRLAITGWWHAAPAG